MGQFDNYVVSGAALEEVLEELSDREPKVPDVEALPLPDDRVLPDVEIVKILLNSEVAGASAVGETVEIYHDGDEEGSPSQTAVVGADGIAVAEIPSGTDYRIVFPQLAGCEPMPDESHKALLIWRALEKTYRNRKEVVTVRVQDMQNGGTVVASEGLNITLNVTGQEPATYVTNEEGVAVISIPYGLEYTITMPVRSGWYIRNSDYSITSVASAPARTIQLTYREFSTGLWAVDGNGREYTAEQLDRGIDDGTIDPDNILYVKVATDALVSANGCFLVRIGDVTNPSRTATGLTWGASTLLEDIPANGNSVGAQYYYDGLGACRAIKAECEERGISNVAVKNCLAQSITVGEDTLQGFLGSVGQWAVLWANRTAFDELLSIARPGLPAARMLSTFTQNKWTSTQYNAYSAWCWATSASNSNKSNGYAVLPFFAY